MKNAAKNLRRPARQFTAADKCRAVLLVWTEKRSSSQLARELGLTWTALNQWQEQAISGMLSALEPRRPTEPKPCPLNARLAQLLERKALRTAAPNPALPAALQKRLTEHRETPAELPPQKP